MRAHMNGIGQISRTVRDIGQAQEWYGRILGLKHLYSFGDMAFFDCQGTRLYLHQKEKINPEESTLYFRVDDIAARYRELQGRGVEFLQAPHLIHRHEYGLEEWMAFFKDPDGRVLALMAQVKPLA